MDKPYYIFLKENSKMIIKNVPFLDSSFRFLKIRITYKNYKDKIKIVQNEFLYREHYSMILNNDFPNIEIKEVLNVQIFYCFPTNNINYMTHSVIVEEYKNEENLNKIKEICHYNRNKLKIMREE